MIQIGSQAEVRCVIDNGHEAFYSPCTILNISPKTIEVKYCSKVNFKGDLVEPVIKRDIIARNKIVSIRELF